MLVLEVSDDQDWNNKDRHYAIVHPFARLVQDHDRLVFDLGNLEQVQMRDRDLYRFQMFLQKPESVHPAALNDGLGFIAMDGLDPSQQVRHDPFDFGLGQAKGFQLGRVFVKQASEAFVPGLGSETDQETSHGSLPFAVTNAFSTVAT